MPGLPHGAFCTFRMQAITLGRMVHVRTAIGVQIASYPRRSLPTTGARPHPAHNW